MGTFEGHAIPSVIYTFIGLWWSFVTAVKFISAEKYKKSKFKGGSYLLSTIMPCFCCPSTRLRRFPFESAFKILFLSVHMYMEFWAPNQDFFRWEPIPFQHPFWPMPPESLHHIAMLSGFMFGSIVEILIYYGVPFPKRTEQMIALISFLIQAILMLGHLHGPMDIEYHMHYLWTIVITLNFFAALSEAYDPDNFWFIYSRIFFFIVQGTWLMQTAFTVWPQTKNPNYIWGTDHRSVTWYNISLMYHFIGVTVVLLAQYVFVYYSIGFIYRFYKRYEIDMETADDSIKITKRDSNQGSEYSMLMNEEDD